MRLVPPKTYKLGRLTVSVSTNETIIVFAGQKELHVKTFRRNRPHIFRKTIIAVTGFVALTSLIFAFGPLGDKNSVVLDEKEKNRLLQSSNTDYSIPEKHEKLIIREHIVKNGETLSHIAKDYGVSIDTICGSSNLRSYDLIRKGQKLKIPNRDGILYKMKPGSNVVSIAKKYRVSLEKILDQNELNNPDFIPTGQVLFIPDARPQNIIRGFMWPASSRFITCGYGWRRNPFDRRHKQFHSGMDIRARYQWVRSSKYGKVTYAGWLGGYGKTIIVAHPGGWKTLYAHLSRIIVKKGQYVKQGQSIGKSGNTGRSTGPHLHFEIMKNGRHKNPYSYLKRGRS